MVCKMLCIVGLIFFCFGPATARVILLDGPVEGPRSPTRTNYYYPILDPSPEIREQTSRDLDLSFSAGDPNEIPQDIVYPNTKKIYAIPERPIVEINREYERPVPYYKYIDAAPRRIAYEDSYPVYNRKYIKSDNNPGTHKGEVVLELRVIANNNNNNNDV